MRARVVVDACGAESPFTVRDGRDKEGYQVAYGVECTVKGPGVSEAMVGDYDRSEEHTHTLLFCSYCYCCSC